LKIKPITIRIGLETPKGYLRDWFDDVFSRYIPLSIRHTATSQQNQTHRPKNNPPQNADVADRKSDLSTRQHDNVADVADEKADSWEFL